MNLVARRIRLGTLSALVGLLALAARPALAAPTAALTFAATADTYVEQDLPTTAFGGSSLLAADGAPPRRTLLRFTISGLAGRAVGSATLRLYCVNGSSSGGSVRRVPSTSWDERAVTWADAPPADPAVLRTLGPVARGGFYDVDLSALVTGDGSYSLEIASTSADGAFYSSREGAAASAPSLVVEPVPAPPSRSAPTGTAGTARPAATGRPGSCANSSRRHRSRRSGTTTPATRPRSRRSSDGRSATASTS